MLSSEKNIYKNCLDPMQSELTTMQGKDIHLSLAFLRHQTSPSLLTLLEAGLSNLQMKMMMNH